MICDKKKFWPANNKHTLYITGRHTFGEICDMIEDHFGSVDLSDLQFRSESWRTDGVNLDFYYPGAYTEFIVITR